MNTYQRVYETCEKKGITIEDLDEIMELPPNTISNALKNKIDYELLITLGMVLEVSPYWLESGQKLNKMTPREESLIMLFRLLDDRGKANIMQLANSEIRYMTMCKKKKKE